MAIIIIKKHRNGGIFGEYRPAVLEFNAPTVSLFRALYLLLPFTHLPPPPPPHRPLVDREDTSHFFSSHLISRPTLVKNAREYKELHY